MRENAGTCEEVERSGAQRLVGLASFFAGDVVADVDVDPSEPPDFSDFPGFSDFESGFGSDFESGFESEPLDDEEESWWSRLPLPSAFDPERLSVL